jgi:hypothetical protein
MGKAPSVLRTDKEVTMSNVIRQIINIANNDLTIIEHKGERVVTLAMIDQVHQRPDGTARRNLNSNRERFMEGKHLYKIYSDEFRTSNPGVAPARGGAEMVLLTLRGYLLLVKSFTDDLSWQVQDMLVDGYFESKPLTAPPGTQRIANHRLRLSLAKELHRTRDPELRKLIHEQLADVSNSLGLSVPSIESLGHESTRMPNDVKAFWDALAYLDSQGVPYNHAKSPTQLALNLPQLARLLREHGQPIRLSTDLRQGLWQSTGPRCLHKNHTCYSHLTGKALKCWVFSK